MESAEERRRAMEEQGTQPTAKQLLREQFVSGKIGLEEYERLLSILMGVRTSQAQFRSLNHQGVPKLGARVAAGAASLLLLWSTWISNTSVSPETRRIVIVGLLISAVLTGLHALCIKPTRGNACPIHVQFVENRATTGGIALLLAFAIGETGVFHSFWYAPLMGEQIAIIGMFIALIYTCVRFFELDQLISARHWMHVGRVSLEGIMPQLSPERTCEAASDSGISKPVMPNRDNNQAAHRLSDPLSDRELEVLALIASGKLNKEIAAELYLATGTIKTYTNSLYRKLGVRNRAEAIARARELGLV